MLQHQVTKFLITFIEHCDRDRRKICISLVVRAIIRVSVKPNSAWLRATARNGHDRLVDGLTTHLSLSSVLKNSVCMKLRDS